MHLWSTLWVAGVCWLLPTTLLAHGGEDHSQETPAPALTTTLEPRVEPASRAVELVAILQKDGLLIYLDRYANNEPINGATLTVDMDSKNLTAAPVGPGLYRLAEAAGLLPDDHELVFTIAAPGFDDVLISTTG